MSESRVTTTDHFVDSPGGGLFARRWQPAAKPGPTILLFHDSLGSVELWRGFPETLAAATGLAVVAYDRLGFGRSSAHSGRLALDFMADEARAGTVPVVDGLGLERFIAFGHSVGGAMAVESAVALGARCAAVVTMAAQTFVEDRTAAGIREAQRLFADPEQIARLARYHGDKASWVLEAWTGTWLDPGFADWDLRPTLERLRCPILAIHGDRDEYGSPVHPRRIEELAGGPAALALLDDCGHVPHREHQDRVLAAVTAFLAGV